MEKFSGFFSFIRYDDYFKFVPTIFDVELREPNIRNDSPLMVELLIDQHMIDSLLWMILYNKEAGQAAKILIRAAGKNKYYIIFNLSYPCFPISQFAKQFSVPEALRPGTDTVRADLYSEARIRLINPEIKTFFIDGADCQVNFHGFKQNTKQPTLDQPFTSCQASLGIPESVI